MVAEGVETREELERLRTMQCRLAQGYLFDTALTGVDFKRRLVAQYAT